MNRIMVCVTLQNTCEQLIHAAEEVRGDNGELFVLHVAKTGKSFMGSENDASALEYLYGVSQKAGADMTVIHSDDVIKTICDFVDENNIHTAVFGLPGKNDKDNGFISVLEHKLKDKCKIILIQKGE